MNDDEQTDNTAKNDDAAVGPGTTATTILNGLQAFNDKVTAMRTTRMEDPDSLGDKIIKLALPSIAGLVAGKLFESLWNAGVGRRAARADNATRESSQTEQRQGLLMSLAFAGLSAAFGAVISQLSDRGSKTLVAHRQHKRAEKH